MMGMMPAVVRLVAFVMALMVCHVMALVVRMMGVVGTMQAMVERMILAVMDLAACLMGRTVRMGIGALQSAATGVVDSAAALAVETRLGLGSINMADGVLLLREREDMRIAAGLDGAALFVVLRMMMRAVSGTGHVLFPSYRPFRPIWGEKRSAQRSQWVSSNSNDGPVEALFAYQRYTKICCCGATMRGGQFDPYRFGVTLTADDPA